MKMTIDDAIKGVEKRILSTCDNDVDHKALETAIAIMRKYQKIKTIIDMDISYHFAKEMRLSAISRVVHCEKQEEQFWKFLDEVDNGDDD